MSSYYEKIVFRSKEISKKMKYNPWEERVNLFMSIGLVWLSIALIYATIKQYENGGLFLIIPLVSLAVSYLVLINRQKQIADKEMLLAHYLLNDFDSTISLDILSNLIAELDEHISNARKVAQWAIGGFITLFIFIAGIFGNFFSTLLGEMEIPKTEMNNALSNFEFNSVIGGIFTLTMLGFILLSLAYPFLQIHTFSKRRYKKMFKNMEYLLLEHEHKEALELKQKGFAKE